MWRWRAEKGDEAARQIAARGPAVMRHGGTVGRPRSPRRYEAVSMREHRGGPEVGGETALGRGGPDAGGAKGRTLLRGGAGWRTLLRQGPPTSGVRGAETASGTDGRDAARALGAPDRARGMCCTP